MSLALTLCSISASQRCRSCSALQPGGTRGFTLAPGNNCLAAATELCCRCAPHLTYNSLRARWTVRAQMVCGFAHCDAKDPHLSFQSCELKEWMSDVQKSRSQIRTRDVR
jgi:hypothetical protein